MKKCVSLVAVVAFALGGLAACSKDSESAEDESAAKKDDQAAKTAKSDESGPEEKQDKDARETSTAAKKTQFPPEMMAWVLGSKLSLTALGYSRGVDQGVADRMMKKCQVIAQALGAKVPPLFKRTGESAKDGAAAMNYVLSTAGKPIGKILASKHSPAVASLFELALKSNLLHLLYVPGKTKDGVVGSIVKVIKSRAQRAGIPGKLTSSLLQKIGKGAPSKDVRKELRKMHGSVKAHLASAK